MKKLTLRAFHLLDFAQNAGIFLVFSLFETAFHGEQRIEVRSNCRSLAIRALDSAFQAS